MEMKMKQHNLIPNHGHVIHPPLNDPIQLLISSSRRAAGISARKLIQAHGSLDKCTCLRCEGVVDADQRFA